MYRVCFVCYANACRSPLAEFFLNDMIKENNLEDCLSVESRGVSNIAKGHIPMPPIQFQLIAHGYSRNYHHATPLAIEMYDEFDMFIGMDEKNIIGMKEIFGGDPKGKLYKLMSFKGETRDVVDPWETKDFETAWIDVYDGCLALFRYLKENCI